MSSRAKYDIVGIAASGTPQQAYTRYVKHWLMLANPDNTATVYIGESGSAFPNQIPLAAGMSFSHGDFEKQGFDEPIDLTSLYITGTGGDYLHLIVFYEDR
jgi:hypothetical protein